MGQKINVSIGDDDERPGFFRRLWHGFLWLLLFGLGLPLLAMIYFQVELNHEQGLYESRTLDRLMQERER